MKILMKITLIILLNLLFFKCTEENLNVAFEKQHYFYSNTQGNNSIEGSHIYISKKKGDTLYFDEEVSKIIKEIDPSWIVGQGSGKPYYDTGKEYYWHVLKVLPGLNAVITAPVNRYFNIKKPVVFWNLGHYPVKLSDSLKGSWGFSKIILDKKDSLFKTHLFECDTDVVNLYIATSKNLSSWKIKHLLEPNDFRGVVWNAPDIDHKMKKTPIISDIVLFEDKYYSFAFGDNKFKKTFISVLISDSLEGKYKVHPFPLVSPNLESGFSNDDVYFPKVVRSDSSWLMFYTSRSKQKDSFLCVAKSNNLIDWTVIREDVLPRNKGWNSGIKNMICAQVKVINNKLYLWVTGTKDVGDFSSPNKGNSMDICIGKFYAPLNSYNFKEAKGNPVFGGNPSFEAENDHVGAAFQEINYGNYIYTFYHGKGRAGKKYTILMK